MLVGAGGLGLVVVQFMPYGPNQPIVYGTVLLFAAAGLLCLVAAFGLLGGAARAAGRRRGRGRLDCS